MNNVTCNCGTCNCTNNSDDSRRISYFGLMLTVAEAKRFIIEDRFVDGYGDKEFILEQLEELGDY